MSASADRPGSVHHREGTTCPECGDTIRAIEYRAYTIDYCPTCQTGGKVLADNTTSKFLK
jgi:formamidopyrimidine-DNA glycosylase